jgi:predicted RNA-binding Zn ribbon-like protein
MPQWSPGPGLDDEELLLAVANTAHGEHDELAGADAVRAWWDGLGAPAAAPDAQPSADGADLLRRLRVLIRGLALRNNGIEPDLGGAAGLEAFTLRLDPAGALTLRAAEPGDLARDIAAATVAALLRATARPDWSRVKACRGDDCRWVFVDRSRNCSRRWCAMAECGNRAKSAAFRSRHRATTRPPVRSGSD